MGVFTKRFTKEQEEAILSVYFTNPFGNISFIRPTRDYGPEEIAANNARYSRSHLPYQKRFLRDVERSKDLDMALVDALVEDSSLACGISLIGDVTRSEAGRIHRQFSLGWKDEAIRSFGDGSIRDAAILSYHVEGIPDIHGKDITHNATGNPQVKSTRYLDWKMGKMSPEYEVGDKIADIDSLILQIESDVDIQNSRHAEEIMSASRKLLKGYEELTDRAGEFVANSGLNQEFRPFYLSDRGIQPAIEDWIKNRGEDYTPSTSEIDAQREKIRGKRIKTWEGYSRKSVFDSTRYLLINVIPTSLANSESVNSFGRSATTLLSSPFETAQSIGRKLMEEGEKISPVLLGKGRTHVQRSEYLVELRNYFMEFAKRFNFERERDYGNTDKRVRDLTDTIPQFTDEQLAVSLMFPYTYGSPEQMLEHFQENPRDVRDLVDIIKSSRGKFDPIPQELLQGGLMKETLIDIGADRDLQRHRRGFHMPQLMSTFLGYETPPLFELAGLDKRYHELMRDADKTFREIVDDDPFVAQLMIPFGFRRRRMYTFGFAQDGFVSELRARDGAHFSYADAARQIHELDKERMPLFSEIVRVDDINYPADLINLDQARDWFNENKREVA